MGPSSIGGTVSMEISNRRFTGLFFEGIGQSDFKHCLIEGLMRDIMISEIPLIGMFVYA